MLDTIWYESVKSEDNNCSLECFIKFMDSKEIADDIRKKLKIKLNTLISIDDAKKISEYFKIGLVICNEVMEIIISHNIEKYAKIIKLIFKDNHCYLFTGQSFYRFCNMCKRKLLTTNTSHICDNNRVSYHKHMISKTKDVVSNRPIAEKEKINEDTLIFYDLETIAINNGIHEPYACDWYHSKNKSILNSKNEKIVTKLKF